MQECSDVLSASSVFDVSLDLPDQRAALLQLYDSTNGASWSNQIVSESETATFLEVVEDVSNIGYGLADGSLGGSSTFPSIHADGLELESLSANCTVQELLKIGQFFLKQEWGSNVSYCMW